MNSFSNKASKNSSRDNKSVNRAVSAEASRADPIKKEEETRTPQVETGHPETPQLLATGDPVPVPQEVQAPVKEAAEPETQETRETARPERKTHAQEATEILEETETRKTGTPATSQEREVHRTIKEEKDSKMKALKKRTSTTFWKGRTRPEMTDRAVKTTKTKETQVTGTSTL